MLEWCVKVCLFATVCEGERNSGHGTSVASTLSLLYFTCTVIYTTNKSL